jgi:hypothetical protein
MFEELQKRIVECGGEPEITYFDKWVIDLTAFVCVREKQGLNEDDVRDDLPRNYVKDHRVNIYWPTELSHISPLVAMVRIVEGLHEWGANLEAQAKEIVAADAKPKRIRKAKATA